MLRVCPLLALLLTVTAISCDSFTAELEPWEQRGAEGSKVALVRAWYEDAIVRVQETQLGKVSNAAVLAAMVAKYPPDWDQAISIPSDSGITRVTTLIGPDQPASTFSPDTLSAVRTI